MMFWTKEEYLKFADAMMDKPVSYYAFEMLYWCGLRMGDDDDKIRLNQRKPSKYKCLRLEGSNFRLGGIAPITWAVPSFRVSMRLAISVAWQKGN